MAVKLAFGGIWRHMTTASTAQGMMGSGSDENKIKIAPSVKNVQSNMQSKYLHPLFFFYLCLHRIVGCFQV